LLLTCRKLLELTYSNLQLAEHYFESKIQHRKVKFCQHTTSLFIKIQSHLFFNNLIIFVLGVYRNTVLNFNYSLKLVLKLSFVSLFPKREVKRDRSSFLLPESAQYNEHASPASFSAAN
jgi:hypothetical protein